MNFYLCDLFVDSLTLLVYKIWKENVQSSLCGEYCVVRYFAHILTIL